MSTRYRGSNWIRRDKRVAIYVRDGFKCVYCGSSESLSLDHIKAVSKGGINCHRNLATSCISCNSSKKAKNNVQWFRILRSRGVDTSKVQWKLHKIKQSYIQPHMAVARCILSLRREVDKAEIDRIIVGK